MINPKMTSEIWWRPSMTRDRPTQLQNAMRKRAKRFFTTLSMRTQVTMAALVAWPDGKEKRSTETVANMSILLLDGRPRRNISLVTPTTIRSRIRTVKMNRLKKLYCNQEWLAC